MENHITATADVDLRQLRECYETLGPEGFKIMAVAKIVACYKAMMALGLPAGIAMQRTQDFVDDVISVCPPRTS